MPFQRNLLRSRLQGNHHRPSLLPDGLGFAVDLDLLQAGIRREGQGVLSSLAGADGERQPGLVEPLPGSQLKLRFIDGNKLTRNGFRPRHPDGNVLPRPRLPLWFPEAGPVLIVNHGNPRQVTMPYGARIQDPGFAPGDSPLPASGLEPNFGMTFQSRIPCDFTRTGFHVDQRLPVSHPDSGRRHRLPGQERHRHHHGRPRGSHPAHFGGNLPVQAQGKLPFDLEKGRQYASRRIPRPQPFLRLTRQLEAGFDLPVVVDSLNVPTGADKLDLMGSQGQRELEGIPWGHLALEGYGVETGGNQKPEHAILIPQEPFGGLSIHQDLFRQP